MVDSEVSGSGKRQPRRPLSERGPRWVESGGRTGLGVSFSCPACDGATTVVLFTNPLDGGPALPDDPSQEGNSSGLRWTRYGDSFETLTLVPSPSAFEAVDTGESDYAASVSRRRSLTAGSCPHWKGFVERGEIL